MEHDSIEMAAVPRGPGRPRSAAAHSAILDAAIALIRELGYDAVTMDGIAARAGVGKATVYRRWAGKEALVADALHRIMRAVPVPDTGSARGDLRALLRSAMHMYRDPATGPLLSGLVAAMARSAPIAETIRDGFVAAWRDAVRQVLRRGIRRGELRRGLDLELAIDAVSAPFFYRYLLLGSAIDATMVRRTVDLMMRGLAHRGSTS
jgi:AcrR family transcriptional regulator